MPRKRRLPGQPALSVVEGASPLQIITFLWRTISISGPSGKEVKLWSSAKRGREGTGPICQICHRSVPEGTPTPTPYPPSIFFHPTKTLQIICNPFEINACGKFSGPKYPTW